MHGWPVVMTICGTNTRSVYRPNAGHADQDSCTYYRVNVFFTVLDAILQDLALRFGPHHQKIAGLSRLVPSFLGTSTWCDIVPAFEKYGMFLDPVNVVKVSSMVHYYSCCILEKFINFCLVLHSFKC